MKGPEKIERPVAAGRSGVQNMRANNTTTSKTVKISAPFRLNAAQRKILVNRNVLNVASPAGRQDGDFLYTAEVTVIRENAAVYTTAPVWACVEIS